MSFVVRAAERARKHDPKTILRRRDDHALPFLDVNPTAGHDLLLDTCVYIDQMQERAGEVVDALLAVRMVNHSIIAVQELLHAVGVLDPADVRSKKAVGAIEKVIDAMPSHRLFTPDAESLAAASVYAGMLCRTQGYAKDDKMSALHDCVLFLQAIKLGLCILTRNVRDFDFLLQMRPDGRVLFYRI